MAEGKNLILGILAIILGIIIIAFPAVSAFTLSFLIGIGILLLGIWFIVQGFRLWGGSKAASIAYIILGIIAIIAGVGLVGNIVAFAFLVSFMFYLAGFFILISGILTLFTGEGGAGKGIGVLGIILGILFIYMGLFPLFAPLYLVYIIGFWLIFDGIALFFVKPSEMVNAPESG
ncbi:MAG: DUF308 domain-containing protein [Methanobacterium sp.]